MKKTTFDDEYAEDEEYDASEVVTVVSEAPKQMDSARKVPKSKISNLFRQSVAPKHQNSKQNIENMIRTQSSKSLLLNSKMNQIIKEQKHSQSPKLQHIKSNSSPQILPLDEFFSNPSSPIPFSSVPSSPQPHFAPVLEKTIQESVLQFCLPIALCPSHFVPFPFELSDYSKPFFEALMDQCSDLFDSKLLHSQLRKLSSIILECKLNVPLHIWQQNKNQEFITKYQQLPSAKCFVSCTIEKIEWKQQHQKLKTSAPPNYFFQIKDLEKILYQSNGTNNEHFAIQLDELLTNDLQILFFQTSKTNSPLPPFASSTLPSSFLYESHHSFSLHLPYGNFVQVPLLLPILQKDRNMGIGTMHLKISFFYWNLFSDHSTLQSNKLQTILSSNFTHKNQLYSQLVHQVIELQSKNLFSLEMDWWLRECRVVYQIDDSFHHCCYVPLLLRSKELLLQHANELQFSFLSWKRDKLICKQFESIVKESILSHLYDTPYCKELQIILQLFVSMHPSEKESLLEHSISTSMPFFLQQQWQQYCSEQEEEEICLEMKWSQFIRTTIMEKSIPLLFTYCKIFIALQWMEYEVIALTSLYQFVMNQLQTHVFTFSNTNNAYAGLGLCHSVQLFQELLEECEELTIDYISMNPYLEHYSQLFLIEMKQHCIPIVEQSIKNEKQVSLNCFYGTSVVDVFAAMYQYKELIQTLPFEMNQEKVKTVLEEIVWYHLQLLQQKKENMTLHWNTMEEVYHQWIQLYPPEQKEEEEEEDAMPNHEMLQWIYKSIFEYVQEVITVPWIQLLQHLEQLPQPVLKQLSKFVQKEETQEDEDYNENLDTWYEKHCLPFMEDFLDQHITPLLKDWYQHISPQLFSKALQQVLQWCIQLLMEWCFPVQQIFFVRKLQCLPPTLIPICDWLKMDLMGYFGSKNSSGGIGLEELQTLVQPLNRYIQFYNLTVTQLIQYFQTKPSYPLLLLLQQSKSKEAQQFLKTIDKTHLAQHLLFMAKFKQIKSSKWLENLIARASVLLVKTEEKGKLFVYEKVLLCVRKSSTQQQQTVFSSTWLEMEEVCVEYKQIKEYMRMEDGRGFVIKIQNGKDYSFVITNKAKQKNVLEKLEQCLLVHGVQINPRTLISQQKRESKMHRFSLFHK